MSIAMKVSFSNKPAVTTSAPYSNQRKLYGMEHFFTSPFAQASASNGPIDVVARPPSRPRRVVLALPCPWCKCTLDLTYYISEGGPDTTQQHDTQQTQQQQQQQQQAAMRTQSPAVSSIYLSHALPAHRAAVSPPVGTAAQHATRRVADDNLRAAEASASPGADRRGDNRVAETRQLIQNLRLPPLQQ